MADSSLDRPTRGRPSKIDQLPDDIKAQLDAMLREGHTQKSILDYINPKLESVGEGVISRSGLNRYSTKMESVGREIREVRELSEVWVAKLGTKPTGDVSAMLMEMVRTNYFKLFMKLQEDPEAVMDFGMLKDVALGIQRIESAALQTHKRETDIRKAFAEEAAKEIEATAAEAGWSADTVQAAKNRILGIA